MAGREFEKLAVLVVYWGQFLPVAFVQLIGIQVRLIAFLVVHYLVGLEATVGSGDSLSLAG